VVGAPAGVRGAALRSLVVATNWIEELKAKVGG
jgi:hypothetical protein